LLRAHGSGGDPARGAGSGGCWRTLEGLAEFALVQSYLSTAAKWGISKLDALRDLFGGHAWFPPASNPPDNVAALAKSHLTLGELLLPRGLQAFASIQLGQVTDRTYRAGHERSTRGRLGMASGGYLQ